MGSSIDARGWPGKHGLDAHAVASSSFPERLKRHAHVITTVVAAVVTILAGILGLAGEPVSIGTLLAFVIVCLGVLALRATRPDIDRPFKAPWSFSWRRRAHSLMLAKRHLAMADPRASHLFFIFLRHVTAASAMRRQLHEAQ